MDMTLPDPSRDAVNYRLLGRLKQDCEYYLGHGNRDRKRLWAGDEAEQIAKMKELYAAFREKPQWITLDDIARYEAAMIPAVTGAHKAADEQLEGSDYWYLNRHELEPGQVFRDFGGSLVKLDRRVPGDGTKWYVAQWVNDGWAYMDSEIEPRDLRGQPLEDPCSDSHADQERRMQP